MQVSVGRSSALFAAGTLLSRISGLARDIIVAAIFGASALLDAFIVANRIPNLFREMLAEGALGSSFTKVYSGLETTDEKLAKQFLCDALRIGFLFAFFVVTIGVLVAPWLVEAFTFLAAEGERGIEFTQNTVGLTRILFPYLGLALLSAIVMGVLHQRGYFFASAASPIFLNLGYIFGALVLASWFRTPGFSWIGELIAEPGIAGLAVGVLLGGFMHFGVQFYLVWQRVLKGVYQPTFNKSLLRQELVHVFKLMGPAAIAASAASINVLVNTNFATSLEAGAVSWLNYAFRLLQLPIALFGVAVGSAVLPALTRSMTRSGNKLSVDSMQTLQKALELVLWLLMPCLIFLYANASGLISLLFQYGAFDSADAHKTAESLQAYSFGLLGYGVIKVLTSFYFAIEKTSYAMKVSLASIAINFLANWALVKNFQHMGLAFATAVTLNLNALLLFIGLWREKVRFERQNLFKTIVYLALAGVGLFVLQQEIIDLLSSFNLISAGSRVKVGIVIQLCLNGAVVVLGFVLFASLRLKRSPIDVLKEAKNFSRQR